jgi:hypothetical protein
MDLIGEFIQLSLYKKPLIKKNVDTLKKLSQFKSTGWSSNAILPEFEMAWLITTAIMAIPFAVSR